jgi:hypothetical protein
MLGLTEPTFEKFNKDKIYVDILLSNDNLFSEICEVVGMRFNTSYSTVLINKQLDAKFLLNIHLLRFCTCFEKPCAHHQKSQLYQYNIWYMSLCVGDRPVCESGRKNIKS